MLNVLKLNNRKVNVLEISFEKEMVDSYFIEAEFTDNETLLTEEELIQLTEENLDALEEEWQEYMICAAEDYYDSVMDR